MRFGLEFNEEELTQLEELEELTYEEKISEEIEFNEYLEEIKDSLNIWTD